MDIKEFALVDSRVSVTDQLHMLGGDLLADFRTSSKRLGGMPSFLRPWFTGQSELRVPKLVVQQVQRGFLQGARGPARLSAAVFTPADESIARMAQGWRLAQRLT